MPRIRVTIGYQDTTSVDEQVRRTRWTADATGHCYRTVLVEADQRPSIEAVAEAVFEADNRPGELAEYCLAGRIRRALIAHRDATGQVHHSFSVGDRVRYAGQEVVCLNSGWGSIGPASRLPCPGERVKVTGRMPDDPSPIPIGAIGTVTEVHADVGQILVDWDDQRRLILLTTDPFEIIPGNPDK